MRRPYTIVFMMIIFLAIVAGTFSPAMADVLLGVPLKTQEHGQWCWAGTSQAVIEYYGSVTSQCNIANWAWGRNDCCGNTNFNWDHPCNQPNQMSISSSSGSLQAILAHWAVNSNFLTTYLSKSTVVSEINAGRPFVMRFGWIPSGGHFLDGYGYDQNGDFVDYMDPWTGNGYTRSAYDWVVSSSDHDWTHTLQVTTNIAHFSDIPTGFWAKGYINAIFNAGYTTGYGGTTNFAPDLNVTREQMAAFVIRAKESEPAADYCASGVPFTDITAADWSCKYVKRLYELGVTTGYGGTSQYAPNLLVTRAQMAAFLGRAFLSMP